MKRKRLGIYLVVVTILGVILLPSLTVVYHWKHEWTQEVRQFEARLKSAQTVEEEEVVLGELWWWMAKERRYYGMVMFKSDSPSDKLFPPDLREGMEGIHAKIILMPAQCWLGPLHFRYRFEFVPKDPENLRILFRSLPPAEGVLKIIKDML